MNSLKVADVMTTVLKARPAMPLKEVARVLAESHVSALPVLDADDHVVGVVSDRDVLLKQGHRVPRPAHWWQSGRSHDDLRRAAGDTAGHVMTTEGAAQAGRRAELSSRPAGPRGCCQLPCRP